MKAVLAGFDSERALRLALEGLKAAGLADLETYTPRPLADEPGHTEAAGSPLPLLMFIAGMLGFAAFFLLMTYANTRAYPLDIGGRPNFAWPAFVPIAFEIGVLCAMVTGFVGYFVICRMPQLYDPVDACEHFPEASRDGWFVAVRAHESEALRTARDLLQTLHPISLEEFSA
jgi:Protein of unknown function (DUF3341)